MGKEGTLVTSDYVLDETTTLLRNRKGVGTAVQFLEQVFASKNVLVSWVEPPIFHEAVSLLKSHADKEWSFTDCTSFTIMQQLKIQNAFCFGDHFRQAGFMRLPPM